MIEAGQKLRKPLFWVGSARDDLRDFPDPVKKTMGFALAQAQEGGKHIHAKPLKGFGSAGVIEAVEDFQGNTYRTVYTVRFAHAVYVLHAFQKKSKHGIKTPQADNKIIHQRLEMARIDHDFRFDSKDVSNE